MRSPLPVLTLFLVRLGPSSTETLPWPLESPQAFSCTDLDPQSVEACQGAWRDCRLKGQPIPEELFNPCLGLLGWGTNARPAQQCEETVSVSLDINSDSEFCDDLAISVNSSFVLPGTCWTLSGWLNSACDQCDTWQVLCGCDWPELSTAEPACDTHSSNTSANQSLRLLHGQTCQLRCLPNFTTHLQSFICHDGQFYTFDPSTTTRGHLLPSPSCYDAGPETNGTVEMLRAADEDPRRGIFSGRLEFSTGEVVDLSAVSAFSLFWASSSNEQGRFGVRLASRSPSSLWPQAGTAGAGVGIGASVRVYFELRAMPIPQQATHLLAFADNRFGEVLLASWLIVDQSLVSRSNAETGEEREPEALETFRLVLAGSSLEHLQDSPWFLNSEGGNCREPEQGQRQVQGQGQGQVEGQKYGLGHPTIGTDGTLNWDVQGGLRSGTHLLCVLPLQLHVQTAAEEVAASERDYELVAILRVSGGRPHLEFDSGPWMEGRNQLITVHGSFADANFSALVLLAVDPDSEEGFGPICSREEALQFGDSRLLAESHDSLQEWQVWPRPGRYRLCWWSCSSRPWRGCQEHRSEDVILVAACDESILPLFPNSSVSSDNSSGNSSSPASFPRPQSMCLQATPSLCATHQGRLVNATPCQQLLPKGEVPPLVLQEEGLPALPQPEPQPQPQPQPTGSFQPSQDFDDRLVPVGVAPDGSYVAVIMGLQLHLLGLGDGGSSNLTVFARLQRRWHERTLQQQGTAGVAPNVLTAGTGRLCEYLLPEVVEDLANQNDPKAFHPFVSCGDDTSQEASSVSFQRPVALRIALSGMYILVADAWANRVRRLDLGAWTAHTVAGTGQASPYVRRLAHQHYRAQVGLGFLHALEGRFSGDGGPAVQAHLNMPADVAISLDDSSFLIADRMNHRVRLVRDGIISTVAGQGPPTMPLECGGSSAPAPGPARAAQLFEPTGVELLPGTAGAVIIAERACHRLRLVDACGTIHTLSPAAPIRFPVQPRVSPGGSDLLVLQDCEDQVEGTGSFTDEGTNTQASLCSVETWNRRLAYSMSLSPQVLSLAACEGQGSGQGQSNSQDDKPGHLGIPLPLSPVAMDGSVVGDAIAVVTGVAMGSDGGIFLVAGEAPPRLLKASRRPLKCPSLQHFHREQSLCVCEPGTRNSSGICTPCGPGEICDGTSETLSCPGLRTTFRRASLFSGGQGQAPEEVEGEGEGQGQRGQGESGFLKCTPGSPDFDLYEGSICMDTPGASSLQECTCPHGLYSGKSNPNSTCQTCPGLEVDGNPHPQGLLCPADWSPDLVQQNIRAQNGFWITVAPGGTAYYLFECERQSNCWWTTLVELWNTSIHLGCAWNFTACASQAGHTGGRLDTCLHRRTGFACGRCTAGYVEDFRGHCVACRGAGLHMHPALVLGKFLVHMLMLVSGYFFINQPRGSKFMATYTLTTCAASVAEFVQQYNLLAKVALAPMPIVTFILQMVPSFVFSLVPSECLVPDRPNARYIFNLVHPWTLPFTLYAAVLITRVTASVRQRLPQTLPARLPAWPRTKLESGLAHVRNFQMEKDKILNTLGFCLAALYSENGRLSVIPFQANQHAPPTTLEPLPGSTSPAQPPIWTLVQYPDVREDSDTMKLWWPLGCVAILFYTVGMFAFHVHITWQARRRFPTEPAFRVRYKYAFAKFRDDRYYWGLVVMVRAILNNIIGLVEYRLGKLPQAQAFVAVNATFLLLLCIFSPYKNALNSTLDVLLNCMLLCMQVVGMAGFSSASDRHAAWNTVVLGFGTVLAFVVATLCLLIRAARPDGWSKQRDNSVTQLALFLRWLSRGIRMLEERSLKEIVSGFSVSERQAMLRDLRFIHPGESRRLWASRFSPRLSRFSMNSRWSQWSRPSSSTPQSRRGSRPSSGPHSPRSSTRPDATRNRIIVSV